MQKQELNRQYPLNACNRKRKTLTENELQEGRKKDNLRKALKRKGVPELKNLQEKET